MNLNKKAKLFVKSNRTLLLFYNSIFHHNEIMALKNKLNIRSKKPSIIHFSINKAATQTVKAILTDCSSKNNYIPIHWTDYAFNSKHPPLCCQNIEEVKPNLQIFNPQGVFYSAFSGFVPGIPQLDKYKIILMLRDPRDILVSDYFSIKFSHLPPTKFDKKKYDAFMRRRNEALNLDIDSYVLNNMHRVFYEFEKYDNNLLGNSSLIKNTLVTKYEEMVNDFDLWLEKIITFCEFENIDKNYLIKKYNRKPKTENPAFHIRKGIAGDYMEKLKPTTIKTINENYNELLTKFKYL